MVMDADVNVTFSLSLPLDLALEVLSFIQKKDANGSPKEERNFSPVTSDKETSMRVPVDTLDTIIELLAANYGDGAFHYANALKLAKEHGISRTTLGCALRYGVGQQVLTVLNCMNAFLKWISE